MKAKCCILLEVFRSDFWAYVRVQYRKFCEELIAYFPLIRHGPHIKRRVQQFVCCFMCIQTASVV
jgi:hypothetical protein